MQNKEKIIVAILLSIIVAISCACEPEEISLKSVSNQTFTSQNSIPNNLLGEYVLHTGNPKSSPIVLAISENSITLLDEFNYEFTEHQIFVNGSCWTIIKLDNNHELRISDYIKEQNFIVLSYWVNGSMIKEYGVYDKVNQAY